VGHLAAGIAHEIGNPIGIILGYLELITKGDLTKKDRDDFINRIGSEINRINQIIRQLLDFSRPSNGKPEETHAHTLIMNTLDILTPQPMMEDTRINLELNASSDKILADPNQLQQVFLNIVMNAADALGGKDPLEDNASGKELIMESNNTSDSIEIGFADNGPGLAEEELVRIFDPFYTTKDPGKGTGLGLSVSYRIVEGLGGTIRAESRMGKGTTITVTLPLFVQSEGTAMEKRHV
jgi:signal transduction histidine kinase